MYKNIFIIGPGRAGKTTLAKMINKRFGYSIISIDDIVSGLEVYTELGIHHDGDAIEISKKLAPFLLRYLKELAEGSKFYDDCKMVIEGTDIDFDMIMPFLQNDDYSKKYEIIGLTYNNIDEEQLYNYIKKYDTEDEWTYWCNDEELRGNVKYFINKNKYFNEMFKKYGIRTFDTSFNRKEVLNDIMDYLEDLENGKKKSSKV